MPTITNDGTGDTVWITPRINDYINTMNRYTYTYPSGGSSGHQHTVDYGEPTPSQMFTWFTDQIPQKPQNYGEDD